MAEDEGFDGRFAFGANRKEQSASSCRLARLRRSLALDGFESRKTSEKKEETPEGVSSWQRMRDSNPRKRSQSPVCYRYTNPLCGRFAYRVTSNMGIIAPKRKMSSIIFLFPRLFSPSTGCPHRKENMYRKEGKMKKALEKRKAEWYYGNVTFWDSPGGGLLADFHEQSQPKAAAGSP